MIDRYTTKFLKKNIRIKELLIFLPERILRLDKIKVKWYEKIFQRGI